LIYLFGILALQTFSFTIVRNIFFLTSVYLELLWHGGKICGGKKKKTIVEPNPSLRFQAFTKVLTNTVIALFTLRCIIAPPHFGLLSFILFYITWLRGRGTGEV
jgi:hypothetical protein